MEVKPKARHSRVNRIQSEDEFQKAIACGKDRVNLGDGLFIALRAPGRGVFQYRLNIDNKDTTRSLCSYPQTCFTDARRLADEIASQKNAAADAKRLSKIKKDLKNNTHNKRMLALKCTAELRTLYQQVRCNPNIDVESKTVTLLALLVPVCAERLSTLRRSCWTPDNRLQIPLSEGPFSPTIKLSINNDLVNLIRSDRSLLNEYLFSISSEQHGNEIKRMIENNLSVSQPKDQKKIRLSDIEESFYFICQEEAGFNEKFIQHFKQNLKESVWVAKYWRQIDTAVNWYSERIMNGVSEFIDQFDSHQTRINDLV